MRPYPTDLREQVVAAVEAGVPRAQVAATFGVSLPTITRYLHRARTTGTLAPRSIPGRPGRKAAALSAWLPPRLRSHPDATLAEHAAAFTAATGTGVSVTTVSRALAALPEGPRRGATERPQ